MDDNWEGICTSGLLKQYCKGPIKLENVTLVCWVAWYDCSKKTSVNQTSEVDIDGLPVEAFIDDNQNDDDENSKVTSHPKWEYCVG